MKTHKLYLADGAGNIDPYDRREVQIDAYRGVLEIGRTLKIPIREIMNAEVRAFDPKAKRKFLAIDVFGPTIENGAPTTIRLIHRDFFTRTKVEKMQPLVDELLPLIKDNRPVLVNDEELDVGRSKEGLLKAQYALNVSLLIACHRKLWFLFESPKTIVKKTLWLMLLGGVINIFGVLLVAVPFDNYSMSRNLVRVGWSKKATLITYLVLTYPAYVWWGFQIVKWLTKKEL